MTSARSFSQKAEFVVFTHKQSISWVRKEIGFQGRPSRIQTTPALRFLAAGLTSSFRTHLHLFVITCQTHSQPVSICQVLKRKIRKPFARARPTHTNLACYRCICELYLTTSLSLKIVFHCWATTTNNNLLAIACLAFPYMPCSYCAISRARYLSQRGGHNANDSESADRISPTGQTRF